MAALRSRCRHYIFVLFLSFLLFVAESQLLQIGCLPYFYTTHGVAIVQIYNAGLKSGTSSSLEMQDPKNATNSPSGHHRTTLLGYIFATKSCIEIRGKNVKQQHLPHMSPQYGELRPINGWDLLASLWYPRKFQRVSRLGTVTAWHSSSGHQPKFAALNRGRHLHSEEQPSRWALAHILVVINITIFITTEWIIHRPNGTSYVCFKQ